MSVQLVWVTPEAEKVIVYCARVSSPRQDSPEYEKLLRYLIKHGHWSPFEMASMCLEITTSRAISAQIMRHRSFSFQEFSQRFGSVQNVIFANARRQAESNRQSSTDDLDEETKTWWKKTWEDTTKLSVLQYKQALERGIARESARFLLPMAAQTRLYMSGSVRSWIHYIESRTSEHTQKEHQEIAQEIKTIFEMAFPTVSKALRELHSDVSNKGR